MTITLARSLTAAGRVGRVGRVGRGRLRLLLLLSACLWLAGCSQIPLGTLWQLRKFDLMALDPRQLQVLLYLPASVGPMPETLLIKLTLHRGSSAAQEVLSRSVSLQPVTTPIQGSAQPAAPEPGGHWVWLAMNDADVRRLLALREAAQAWKAADGASGSGRKMEMTVSPQLCQAGMSPVTAGQVRLSAWIRWEAGQPLLPLLEGASGRDIDDKSAGEVLPRCGTLAG